MSDRFRAEMHNSFPGQRFAENASAQAGHFRTFSDIWVLAPTLAPSPPEYRGRGSLTLAARGTSAQRLPISPPCCAILSANAQFDTYGASLSCCHDPVSRVRGVAAGWRSRDVGGGH